MVTALQKIEQDIDKARSGLTGAHLREWFKKNPNASRVQQVDSAYAIFARYSPLPPELHGSAAIEYVTNYRIEHHQSPIFTSEKSPVEIAEAAFLDALAEAEAAWPSMGEAEKSVWYEADSAATPDQLEARAKAAWGAWWANANDAQRAAWTAAIEQAYSSQ
jgi:hypothetical protein